MNCLSARKQTVKHLGALLVALALSIAMLGCGRKENDKTKAEEPSKPELDLGSDWVVYQGNQSLTGYRDAKLPGNPEIIWRMDTGAPTESSPVRDGKCVYIGNDAGVCALNAEDGAVVWEFKAEGYFTGPPLVVEGKVFAGNMDGLIFALDAKTGRKLWTFETGAKIVGSANFARTPDGNLRIYAGSHDFLLYCIDAGTGKSVWSYEAENYINGTPALSDRYLVFGGCDSMVHVLDTETGVPIGSIGTPAYIPGSASLDGDFAYVGNYNGDIIAVNCAKKTTEWLFAENSAAVYATPAVAGDSIVVGSSGGTIYCLSKKDGSLIWAHQAKGTTDVSPVICGNEVLAADDSGRIYIMALSDGAVRWSRDLGSAASGPPALAGKSFIYATEDGRVHAFGEKRATEK